jgi:predicted branched-subunit amino acid permease
MTEDGGRKKERFPLSVLRPPTSVISFLDGLAAAARSIFLFVVFGTYVGIGALAHDLNFSLPWALGTTLLVWAAPNQVILISALGAGMAPLAAAVAVSLSGVRLLPMVVSLLPLIKTPGVRTRSLIVPAHFTAISVWVEGLRLLPGVERARRIAFYNGLGVGLLASASAGTAAGFYLAGALPVLFAAALLFLTPASFLVSVWASSRHPVDRLALALGLPVGGALALADVAFDLVWTGIIAGTLAWLVARIRTRRE